MSEGYIVNLSKDQLLCKEGDTASDLYIVHQGKLLVCVRKGTQVIAVAEIGPGEYMGELSYFDGMSRSADIIAVEDTVLIKIPQAHVKEKFPRWLSSLAKFQTKKLRVMDDVIRNKGIKKKNVQSIKPLSIDEQRYYLKIIEG